MVKLTTVIKLLYYCKRCRRLALTIQSIHLMVARNAYMILYAIQKANMLLGHILREICIYTYQYKIFKQIISVTGFYLYICMMSLLSEYLNNSFTKKSTYISVRCSVVIQTTWHFSYKRFKKHRQVCPFMYIF